MARCVFWLLAFIAFAPDARGQADLAVTSDYSGFGEFLPFVPNMPVSSGGSITPTRGQTLTIAASNLGPVDAQDVYVELRAGSTIDPYLVAAGLNGCSLSSQGPPLTGVRWNLGTLEAGATRSCVVELRAVPGVNGAFNFLRTVIGSSSNVDPVATNNTGPGHSAIFSSIDYVRDIALSINGPVEPVEPGASYLIDFVLENRGPGEVGDGYALVIFTDFYVVGPDSPEFFALSSTGDADCDYRTIQIGGGSNVEIATDLLMGPLDPGQARACTLRLTIAPNATGTRSLPFFTFTETAGAFDADITNNIATLFLQYGQPALDTPSVGVPAVSVSGLAALCGLVLLVAYCRRRAS